MRSGPSQDARQGRNFKMPEGIEVPPVASILHPSDFSAASMNAFAHALALAVLRKTRLTLLHAGKKSSTNAERKRFPRVRQTLERWGCLQPGSSRSAVYRELGVRVEKARVEDRSPLEAILHFVEQKPTEMIVLATEGREGLPRWIHPSMAERVARRARAMTLFVPSSSRGFVSVEAGSISLRRILVPVDQRPDAKEAIVHAARAAGATELPVEVTLLHVGPAAEMAELQTPADDAACRWRRLAASGNVVEQIVGHAREIAADLIVMATEGHDGFLDAVRGSVTEQVLRQANCPLLAVPAR